MDSLSWVGEGLVLMTFFAFLVGGLMVMGVILGGLAFFLLRREKSRQQKSPRIKVILGISFLVISLISLLVVAASGDLLKLFFQLVFTHKF